MVSKKDNECAKIRNMIGKAEMRTDRNFGKKYIFEIPVYAVSPKTLYQRVKYKEKKIEEKYENQYCPKGSKYMDRIIDAECSPMRIWEYNHILGYIKIGVTTQDIWFETYRAEQFQAKYYWMTHKKKFIVHDETIGDHFRIEGDEENSEIGEEIKTMLKSVIKSSFPDKSIHVDSRIFDATYQYLDYKAIMSTVKE